MSMRKQFVATVESQMAQDDRLVLLLGDIGVFGFKRAFAEHPSRTYNIGILEPATVSLASGLGKSNLIPIIHTIAPFLVERSLEQLKIDFGYQKIGGNFVSVGASYDYASLGCTHHCPGDVAVLQTIPGMEIVVPGTATEFDILFGQSYNNGNPTYYRLSERENANTHDVKFGKATVIKRGSRATVIAIGPTLQHVLEATSDIDVTVLYYTTIAPFDSQALVENTGSSPKVLVVEPFYKGTLTKEICESLTPKPVLVETIGVPCEFLTNYGTAIDHDRKIGLNPENIQNKLLRMIND